MKEEGYKYGGSDTAQYYCPVCKRTHNKLSKIGKEHWKYRQK